MSYGGAVLIVNSEKFTCEKLKVHIPRNLKAVWGLLRPRATSAKFKKIIVCSFYSPPNKKKNSNMADHIVTTLQMLCSKYPDYGLILGADRNEMEINQYSAVDLDLDKNAIIDIIIMNVSGYYKSVVIAPPLQPDDPTRAKPSDHSVPVCIPHTDRYTPAARNYRVIKFRPLPESSVRRFGEWIVNENWDCLNDEMSSTEQSVMFEQLMSKQLNKFCPAKEIKSG